MGTVCRMLFGCRSRRARQPRGREGAARNLQISPRPVQTTLLSSHVGTPIHHPLLEQRHTYVRHGFHTLGLVSGAGALRQVRRWSGSVFLPQRALLRLAQSARCRRPFAGPMSLDIGDVFCSTAPALGRSRMHPGIFLLHHRLMPSSCPAQAALARWPILTTTLLPFHTLCRAGRQP